MKSERALFLLMSLALAACADTETKVETETHFLKACEGSCEDGLSCICGVCTAPCGDDESCADLSATASCVAIPSSCGHVASTFCDVTCTDSTDCAAFGESYTCSAGRCRAESDAGAGGSGGSGGAGGSGGSGGAGSGGAGGQGGSGATDGGPVDAEVDGGSDAGPDASINTDCDEIGDTCCDPFPGDGPNFCTGAMIECGPVNQCQSTCGCNSPVYEPVCGVDGVTYDACALDCISVEIACNEECPCGGTYCTYGCTGAAPDQEVIDACEAITDPSSCSSHVTNGIPATCRWVTPSTEPCPPFP